MLCTIDSPQTQAFSFPSHLFHRFVYLPTCINETKLEPPLDLILAQNTTKARSPQIPHKKKIIFATPHTKGNWEIIFAHVVATYSIYKYTIYTRVSSIIIRAVRRAVGVHPMDGRISCIIYSPHDHRDISDVVETVCIDASSCVSTPSLHNKIRRVMSNGNYI